MFNADRKIFRRDRQMLPTKRKFNCLNAAVPKIVIHPEMILSDVKKRIVLEKVPKFRIFSFWVTSITYYRTGNKHIQATELLKKLTISQCSYQFRTIVWNILKYKIIYSFDQGWMLNIPLRAELITGSQEIDLICTLTLIMSISGPSQKTPRDIKAKK